MRKYIKSIALFFFLCCLPAISLAYPWNHSIQLGYGFSHDPNHTKYNNQGILLTSDLLPIYRSYMSYWTLAGALGYLYTNTPVNKNVTTAAVTLALRFYPFNLANDYQPYILGSVGPAFISYHWFGLNEQAGTLTLQSNIGFGVEHNHLDLNLRLHHFSNAGLGKPNEGYNVLYLLSIGYLF